MEKFIIMLKIKCESFKDMYDLICLANGNGISLEDFLSAATTGSSWLRIYMYDGFNKDTDYKETETIEALWEAALTDGKVLNIVDYSEMTEGDGNYKHTLTMEKIDNGVKLLFESDGYDYVKSMILRDCIDLDVADVIMQFAIFGEVIYG